MPRWEPLRERFEAKVARGRAAACWPWMGTCSNRGYGRLKHQGKFISAHRLAWEYAVGPIPEGMQVLHHCDNRPCCNSHHLFLGTHQDNMEDRNQKGRARGPQGLAHASHRLTPEIVRELRTLENPNYSELGRRYGVTHQAIRFAILGQTWKHVA